MGKHQPTAPPPIDPSIAINAQSKANINSANQSAALNHTNQSTPWGDLTWSKKPAGFDQAGYDSALSSFNNQQTNAGEFGGNRVPQVMPTRDQFTTSGPDEWSSKISLNPVQQALLDQQNTDSQALSKTGNGLLGQVNNAMSQPINYNGLQQVNLGRMQNNVDMSNVPGMVGGNALSGAMSDAQNAAYKQAASRLDPQWEQSNHDLQNQLVQQGIMQNSDAWNRATSQQNRNQTDAYQSAQNNAVMQGNAAQAQLYGQGLSSNQNGYAQALNNANLRNQATNANFNNSLTARNQGMNELMTQRSNPLNELNALRNGSQVTSPTFGAGGNYNVGNVDAQGAINQQYQQQMGLYNAQVGQNNSGLGALGSLLGAGIGAAATIYGGKR